MKIKIIVIFTLALLLINKQAFSQEWKNIRSYRKETGNVHLKAGCWLIIDRKRDNEVWKKANLFNLSVEYGNTKYETIQQIRDFYKWFDLEREKKGHEIKWIGIAAIVANQLSKLENNFIYFFIVRNKEVLIFANKGSKKVFEFAFPMLKKVYFSNKIIKGKEAENWDSDFGMNEQCLILDSLYKNLSSKALRKLDKMAKGKGLFRLGVPKELKYEGSIEDCKTRFEHGINKLLLFYESNHEKIQ